MAVVLQIHFPFQGPFGEEMAEAMQALAHSINDEPGFRWKLWTEDSAAQLAGGVYLFDTRDQAESYLEKHSQRLKEMDIDGIQAWVFEVNEALSTINRGPF
ncbi:monooxygenase [Halomonas sp. GXIMD04776]|uniref:monooxygenase n=1 Tax=Halomonas sp. GXIMD04776 TaxID=3415605 RepID=UPI003CB53C43